MDEDTKNKIEEIKCDNRNTQSAILNHIKKYNEFVEKTIQIGAKTDLLIGRVERIESIFLNEPKRKMRNIHNEYNKNVYISNIIKEVIEKNPGINTNKICDLTTEKINGSVYYIGRNKILNHLRKLHESNFVKKTHEKGKRNCNIYEWIKKENPVKDEQEKSYSELIGL